MRQAPVPPLRGCNSRDGSSGKGRSGTGSWVFIDTILICSCTAMIMLLTPKTLTQGLTGMDLLRRQCATILVRSGSIYCHYFMAVQFSTFVGILFYAKIKRCVSFWRQLVFSDRLQDRCPGNAVLWEDWLPIPWYGTLEMWESVL